MKRKFLAMLLTLTLSLTSVFAFAETPPNDNLTIIQDDAQVRIVETNDAQFIYRVTVDKVKNTAQMQITDKGNMNIKVSKKAQLGTGNDKASSDSNDSRAAILATSLTQNTFTNYEYTKTYGNPNQWELRRPQSNITSYYFFKTAETPSNRPYLNQFQGAVQRVNDLEVPVVGAIGVAGLMDILSVGSVVVAIISGGTLTGAAWTVIVASLSLTGVATATLIAYNTACTDAYDAYFEVYKRKA
jgi:protein involved in polysaccharide export with SLBB domain